MLHRFPRGQTGIVASLGHLHSTFMCLPDWRACLLSCFTNYYLFFCLKTGECVRHCFFFIFRSFAALMTNLFPVWWSNAHSHAVFRNCKRQTNGLKVHLFELFFFFFFLFPYPNMFTFHKNRTYFKGMDITRYLSCQGYRL